MLILTKLFLFLSAISYSQPNKAITGADRLGEWLPLLSEKRVAVFANQTSRTAEAHLVDTLKVSGVNLIKIFGPEHGFRGTASAGEELANGVDVKSGLPVVSLYGDHKKPTAKELSDVDVVLFDIQDVGVRFYTYISSLQYLMEACLEQNKKLIILDRPNPNGYYVDGPVLKKGFESFIGMQPIPVVHGMTIGEYALLLLGEKWLTKSAHNNYRINADRNVDNADYQIKIIKCLAYTHNDKYSLPVPPSPNLPEMQSIYLYPSTCWFEGTVLSEGRGTSKPFQIYGHAKLKGYDYTFVPMPNPGAKSSKCYGLTCYGENLHGPADSLSDALDGRIQLKYLIRAYKNFAGRDSFFLKNNFFNKLAGNDLLMKQIKRGVKEKDIRKSWEPDLKKFKAIRRRYLLYQDFE